MKTKNLAIGALFSALTAICAWITIPSPIPFTMQTFAIFLSFCVLGGKYSLFSLLVYIFMGIVGLPVFSGFRGGIGVLLSNTGGYILGFVASILLMWLLEKIFGKSKKIVIISMFAGLFVCYLFGTLWFTLFYTQNFTLSSFLSVATTCVLPFVVPDAVKIFLAYFMSERIRKAVNA